MASAAPGAARWALLFSASLVVAEGLAPGAVGNDPDPSSLSLAHVIYMSRHGVRSPYPPDGGYSSYSTKSFPSAADWGMTQEEYDQQHLTAHGKKLVPLMGAYIRELYEGSGLFGESDRNGCPTKLSCYADDSFRDHQTARLFLDGFVPECDVEILVANGSLPVMEPVLSDHYNITTCKVANEAQMNGTFGGNFPALSKLYSPQIMRINNILEPQLVRHNESICSQKIPNFPVDKNCSLYLLPFEYNGLYYQGMALSPLYYASQFAEAWMFQYLSGLPDWGFNLISYTELVSLYRLHIQVMAYGTNYWNSQRNGAQTLGYILGVMEQIVFQRPFSEGVPNEMGDKFTLLFNHDTNALYLKTLLNLDWLVESFDLNSASTAGAVAFELWKSDDDEYYVRVYYTAATPIQQRYNQTLTASNPPSKSYMIIRPCQSSFCPYSKFRAVVLDSISLDCVEQPLKGDLAELQATIDSSDSSDGGDDSGAWKIAVIVIAVMTGLAILAGISGLLCRYLTSQMSREGWNSVNEDDEEKERNLANM